MSGILVLDDDPRILKTLGIMLRGDGHAVLEATTAEVALELLQHEAIDLALVDLQLPGMDGIEFLKRLRDRHRHHGSWIHRDRRPRDEGGRFRLSHQAVQPRAGASPDQAHRGVRAAAE